MEEIACFVCSLDYKLPTRKPHILECCIKNVCSECLVKIIEEKKCPNCRETLQQTSLNLFAVNVKIEETLNFEEFGDLICDQCKQNSSDKASKLCADCGLICRSCYLSHTRMKIFENHKIRPIPEEKWSKHLEAVLKMSLNCDIHKDQRIESFCKSCEKAVCEECIVNSHKECQSRICTIDHKFEETRQKLQEDLDIIEMNKEDKKCIELMEKRTSEFENLEREIETLKSHCFDVLKRHFDEVKSGFQNKAKIKKDGYEKNKEKLQKMKNFHKNLCDFIDGSSSLQNKAGFLQLAPKVISQTECLQNEIKKIKEEVIDVTEKIDYLMWIKEIFSELQLAAGKNASVDFALAVAEECEGYPFIIKILSQYRRPNRVKCHSDSSEEFPKNLAKEVHSDNSMKSYRAIYKRKMFPRYEYHLELIEKIVDRAHQTNDNIITHDFSKLPDSTTCILVYGKETDVDRNLIQPLFLEDSAGNDNIWRNFILVVFIDTTDDEEGTFDSIEVKTFVTLSNLNTRYLKNSHVLTH